MISIDILHVIDDHPLFQKIAPESREELAACGSVQILAKKEHLFWNQDLVSQLYIVVEGLVVLYRINSLDEKKFSLLWGKIRSLTKKFSKECLLLLVVRH